MTLIKPTVLLLVVVLVWPAAARAVDPPAPNELRVVPQVDLKRYMGSWYEIARYPNRYQKGLVGVIATYTRRPDGKIDVVNTGHKESIEGPRERSQAVGWVTCNTTRAKWHVRFIWPFKADYYIIDLADDYTYAVVGQPNRKHLWILSRTPQMAPQTYDDICNRLREQGYDPSRLVRTPQPAAKGVRSLLEVQEGSGAS